MVEFTDAQRLDWLEEVAREKSPTGISFDWVPSCEGESRGWRFMRRHYISSPKDSLRQAIDKAMVHFIGIDNVEAWKQHHDAKSRKG